MRLLCRAVDPYLCCERWHFLSPRLSRGDRDHPRLFQPGESSTTYILHPLSHFPGPKLAACSRLWLAYREIIRGTFVGRPARRTSSTVLERLFAWHPTSFTFRIPLRITTYITTGTSGTRTTCSTAPSTWTHQQSGSYTTLTLSKRRDVLAPLFSRTSILQMQDLVQERVDVLCDALAHQFAAGKSSDLVLGSQCFFRRRDYGLLLLRKTGTRRKHQTSSLTLSSLPMRSSLSIPWASIWVIS
ncbi:hypothetical protein EDB89DRAFT_1036476 [Lactarius sanguifluus]|nr:hypothetical protein EDB89DRAFT_1036476 [Lactarius sanguifluus]